jgi:uncharacterized membrane protein YraQ (UPF0718 family)
MVEEAEDRKPFWRDAFDTSFLIFAALAVAGGIACHALRGFDAVVASLQDDSELVLFLIPKLGAAVLIARFIQVLLPADFFGRYMGEEKGLKGMAIATAAGAVTPGGPMTSFPLVTMLRDTGTGVGALVAYVTAWTTMGLQRVFMWEVPLMGAEFAAVRFLSSMPLPIVAGLVARLFPAEASRSAGEGR